MAGAVNFFLDTFYLDRVAKVFKNTANEWMDDKAPTLGAALAYYTVFSLAPLVLFLVSIFGLFMHDNGQFKARLESQVRDISGPSAADVTKQIVDSTAKQKQTGVIGTVVAVAIALFGASGVFGQLQESLNTIWGVKAKPDQGIMGYVKARFISFGMVGGVCFMLLVSLTVSTLIEGFSKKIDAVFPGGAAISAAVSILLNLIVVTVLFAMIFKFLPDAKVAWSDTWIGAALTTILFIVGKWGLSLYLGSGSVSSAYGAAGALISLLVWVYYSAQILLFGAEFTQVYANEFGSHIEPEDHAVRVKKREIEIPNPNANAEEKR